MTRRQEARFTTRLMELLPTPSSQLYLGAISVTVSTTVQAIAMLGGSQSAVASSRLIITAPAPTGYSVSTPSISPGTGTYVSTQEVTISDSTTGSKIYTRRMGRYRQLLHNYIREPSRLPSQPRCRPSLPWVNR